MIKERGREKKPKKSQGKDPAREAKLRAKRSARDVRVPESAWQRLRETARNLEEEELQAYGEAFSAISDDLGSLREFIFVHSGISGNALDGELHRLASFDGTLSMADFLCLLRENTISDGDAIQQFLSMSNGCESLPLTDCRRGLVRFVHEELGVDFGRDHWDTLLDLVIIAPFARVQLEEWIPYCCRLFRISRLLCYNALKWSLPQAVGCRPHGDTPSAGFIENDDAVSDPAPQGTIQEKTTRLPGRFARILGNFDEVERQVYNRIFESFGGCASEGATFVPCADPACRDFLIAYTDIQPDDVEVMMLSVASLDKGLGAASFLQLVRDNVVSSDSAVARFLELSGKRERISSEECTYSLLLFMQQRFSAADFSIEDWEDIVEVVMQESDPSVGLEQYVAFCRRFARIVRLLTCRGYLAGRGPRRTEGANSAVASPPCPQHSSGLTGSTQSGGVSNTSASAAPGPGAASRVDKRAPASGTKQSSPGKKGRRDADSTASASAADVSTSDSAWDVITSQALDMLCPQSGGAATTLQEVTAGPPTEPMVSTKKCRAKKRNWVAPLLDAEDMNCADNGDSNNNPKPMQSSAYASFGQGIGGADNRECGRAARVAGVAATVSEECEEHSEGFGASPAAHKNKASASSCLVESLAEGGEGRLATCNSCSIVGASATVSGGFWLEREHGPMSSRPGASSSGASSPSCSDDGYYSPTAGEGSTCCDVAGGVSPRYEKAKAGLPHYDGLPISPPRGCEPPPQVCHPGLEIAATSSSASTSTSSHQGSRHIMVGSSSASVSRGLSAGSGGYPLLPPEAGVSVLDSSSAPIPDRDAEPAPPEQVVRTNRWARSRKVSTVEPRSQTGGPVETARQELASAMKARSLERLEAAILVGSSFLERDEILPAFALLRDLEQEAWQGPVGT